MRVELKSVKISTPKNGNPPIEIKTSKTGKQYAQFTVMESASKKGQAGQWENGPTKFITCRVFGFDAENLHAAVMGGTDRINVAGDLEHFTWQSQNGPRDDWSMFVSDVSLSLPKAQQSGGWSGGGAQQGGGWNNQQPQGQGGFPDNDSEPPF